MMTFHAVGMNYRHDRDFFIDRPEGSGDGLLLIFKSCARVITESGDVTVPPDSAIIYNLGAPQRYGACSDVYINHFLHMGCTEDDNFLTSSGIPLNTVITGVNTGEAEELMRMITREEMSDSPHREEYLDMLIKMLLLKLSDSLQIVRSSHSVSAHGEALDRLRAELYSNAGSFGSVCELAAAVNLSPSHFQQLYKERFGVSGYDDLISARIRTARYYLKNTALTVKQISAICGYENDVCFMRLFKKKTGLTPCQFRKT